ncbi:MAG: cyclase/dehydrase [Deltaproteobacteria bacterium]|nr:cyclase/dehydrase [Deltaproteobacteria bacterium]
MAFRHIESQNRERIARGLGYFSIGLGLAEVAATDKVAKSIGITDNPRGVMRVMGIREIANGVGILAAPREPRWMWSRVAGDAIDLTLLSLALMSPRTSRTRLAGALGAVAAVTALDALCARLLSRQPYQTVGRKWLTAGRGLRIQKSISINSSAVELYRFCREPSNLARISNVVESVTSDGDRQLRWRVKGPGESPIEWRMRIIDDRPNELIWWRSSDSAPIEVSGSIRFSSRPDNRGTIVRVEILRRPLSAGMGTSLQILGSRTEFQVSEALRRLKALIETGEIPTTKGQPSGRPPGLVPVDQEVGQPLGVRALLAR